MSVVVVGLSYRTAEVALLERVTIGADDLFGSLAQAVSTPHVAEALVLSTCNRIEVYADVRAFHAGVGELTALLADRAGITIDELSPQLYVHFEDRAVQHLFGVVCGLDSMVVGESQILGQVRAAYQQAKAADATGRRLDELLQQALRVGKRAHAETGIDQTGSALVAGGLDVAAAVLGPLAGRRALVVGAGSMSALATATLLRSGVTDLVVANRGVARAGELARSVGGRAVGLAALGAELLDADLVVSCTGAAGYVLTAELLAAAQAGRSGRPLVLVDLAVPRDVDPAARELPGVTVVDLDDLARTLAGTGHTAQVDAVRSIVAEEVAAYLTAGQAARVAPTVVALRAMADDVVAAELARFDARRPDVDPAVRAEVERTVRRVVDKLLHAPTVRVKELASEPAGIAYAEALHALFDLDPERYREVAVADLHVIEIEKPAIEKPEIEKPVDR
jgi:glutamyl-tRNA reductase